MSKTTKYPAYTGGEVKLNGKTKASSYKSGDTIVSNYKMSEKEKSIYDSVLNNMDSSIANLFKISDPQRQAWNEQLDLMKQEGINNIDSIYTPMQNNLKNDIASRFGNLDNSTFLNNLKKITDNKAKAVSNLSNNLTMAQSDLYTNELQNRMNILNFLSGLNTSFNNNMLSYMGLANQNSATGNQYSQMAYNSNINRNNNMISQINSQLMQYLPLFL